MHLPLHFAHQACVQAVLARHPHTPPLGQEDRPLEKPAEDLGMERGLRVWENAVPREKASAGEALTIWVY